MKLYGLLLFLVVAFLWFQAAVSDDDEERDDDDDDDDFKYGIKGGDIFSKKTDKYCKYCDKYDECMLMKDRKCDKDCLKFARGCLMGQNSNPTKKNDDDDDDDDDDNKCPGMEKKCIKCIRDENEKCNKYKQKCNLCQV
eukprot:TRINITY_DN2277_c0_g1_i5.p2 TRINITY_DN2277_c0_g1~~TRINITY_DN2277_c0_g1_i5.p2  ORF type:complete len:139 (+),score=22.46 TRINITY_DN2277_c0_g1_i5:208-624(+)